MTRTEELLELGAQITAEEREDTKRYVDNAVLREKRRKAIEKELRQIREGKDSVRCGSFDEPSSITTD